MTTLLTELTTTLAYRPFLDPLPGAASWWWLTIIPLCFLISLTYKAVRVNSLDNMPRYWKKVAAMTLQLLALMLALSVGLHLVVEFIAPAVG